MTFPTAPTTLDVTNKLTSKLSNLGFRPPHGQFLFLTTLLNLFIVIARPQDVIPIIGASKLPLLLSILAGVACVPYYAELWRKDVTLKVMVAFLIIGAIWIPFAVNNFWAYQTFRDVLQLFLCFLFPTIALSSYLNRLKNLQTLIKIIAIYLGTYVIMHVGKGPGGYMGDENDVCQLIGAISVFCVGIIKLPQRTSSKWITFLAVGISISAVITTMSRGGFVGLTVAGLYLLWRSPNKVLHILVILVIGLIAAFAAPSTYWKEMSSITDTNERTAQGRISVWSTGWRMWTDPPNFLFGTGMRNGPRHILKYETFEQLEKYPSQQGRAFHSTYVEVITDLGLVGLILFSLASVGNLYRTHRTIQILQQKRTSLVGHLAQTYSLISSQLEDSSTQPPDNLPPVEKLKNNVVNQLEHAVIYMVASNASLMSALCSAIFISTLYYPTIWFFISLNIAARIYAKQLMVTISEFPQSLESEKLPQVTF